MSYEMPPYGGFPPEQEPRDPWWKSTAFIISVCVTLVAAMGIAIALVMINKNGSDDKNESSSTTSSEASQSDGTESSSSDDGQTSADAPGAGPSGDDSPGSTDPSVGGGPDEPTASAGDEPAMTVDDACANAAEASGTWISTDPAWGISSGSEVLVATTLLDALGYGPGPSTEFTDAHAEATLEYQSDFGLTADGVIGDDTWPVLIDQVC